MDPRKGARVDAVALHPSGKRKQIGVGDRIRLAHDPRAAKQLALDQVETGADGLRNFLSHRFEGLGLVGPAIAAHAMGMRDMHRCAEIVVERLQFGEGERIVERSEPRLGIALRNEGEDGWRFGQHAALGNQRRHATFRIDREILGLRLLGASEVDPSRFEGGAGLFERDMRRQGAGVGRIIESEHDSSSLVAMDAGAN